MNGNDSSNGINKKGNLEWLGQLREKHNKNIREINGKRISKLKRGIIKKANTAIQSSDSDGEIKRSYKCNKKKEKENKITKTQERQRVFAKHLDLKASFPKTLLENSIEEKMNEAIRNNNLSQMEHLNKQLLDIHLNQALQAAEKKTRFEMKQIKDKERHKERYRPMLDWKFTKKERWERKSNS